MTEDIMSKNFEDKPFNLIKDSKVKWEITYDICPIQLEHAISIVDFLAEEKLFENFDVGFVSQNGRVTSFVVKVKRNGLNLASMSHAFETRLNDLLDRFLDNNCEHAVARA
jgi:hypothetical protein